MGWRSMMSTRNRNRAKARAERTGGLDRVARDGIKDVGESALIGGAYGAVSEAVNAYGELERGEIDGLQYAGRVAGSAALRGGEAAAKKAAGLALKEGAKVAAKRVGSESLKRAVGSTPATAVVFGIVDQVVDTGRYAAGSIDGSELGRRTVQNAGSTGGAIGCAAAGAAIGSVVPGVGTVIGGVVGGLIGGLGGSAGGRALGRLFWDE